MHPEIGFGDEDHSLLLKMRVAVISTRRHVSVLQPETTMTSPVDTSGPSPLL